MGNFYEFQPFENGALVMSSAKRCQISGRLGPGVESDPHPFLQAVMAATPNQSPSGVPENAAD